MAISELFDLAFDPNVQQGIKKMRDEYRSSRDFSDRKAICPDPFYPYPLEQHTTHTLLSRISARINQAIIYSLGEPIQNQNVALGEDFCFVEYYRKEDPSSPWVRISPSVDNRVNTLITKLTSAVSHLPASIHAEVLCSESEPFEHASLVQMRKDYELSLSVSIDDPYLHKRLSSLTDRNVIHDPTLNADFRSQADSFYSFLKKNHILSVNRLARKLSCDWEKITPFYDSEYKHSIQKNIYVVKSEVVCELLICKDNEPLVKTEEYAEYRRPQDEKNGVKIGWYSIASHVINQKLNFPQQYALAKLLAEELGYILSYMSKDDFQFMLTVDRTDYRDIIISRIIKKSNNNN